MTIKRPWGWTALFAMLIVPMMLWGAPKTGSPDVSTPQQPDDLKQQLIATLQSRDAALAEIDARFRQAAPADKSLIEAEAVQTQLDYERSYLSLLIEYHSVTGNTVEQHKAEQMLNALDGTTPAASTPQAPRDKMSSKPAVESGQEGVIVDEQ